MSTPSAPTLSQKNAGKRLAAREPNESTQSPAGASLLSYALLGVGAILLLSAIEFVDLQIQLTPVFDSFSERLMLTAYMGLNLAVGAAIGLLLWLVARAGSFLRRRGENLISGGRPRFIHRAVVWIALCFLAAVALNQVPEVHSYVTGLIIEAQKLPYVYGRLLKYDTIISYFVLAALVAACAIFWMLARKAFSCSRPARVALIIGLAALLAAAYYVDSRYEAQLYEYTLHRSMFLLAVVLAMTLVAVIFKETPRQSKSAFTIIIILILMTVGFTFWHFGSNQNLKVQVFTRTTQTKQHFKLAQWAFDFDRDGYSARLGGGDENDGDSLINPDAKEQIGDGVDNNLVGGDLSADDLAQWMSYHSSFQGQPFADARPYNLIFIFIDTVRADHLGAYGYHRNTSPNIDKLAARSALFENAFSPSANTFESAARFMKSSYWDAEVKSWSEILVENGYNAMLFPQRRLPMLRRYVKGVPAAPDAQGKSLKDTIDLTIEHLGKAPSDRPFFAYIYAVDPHRPYAKHKKFDFGASTVDLYDGEIAFTDYHFGRLFDWMEQSGRMDDTVIVIMADHAESLGERAIYRHSAQLYNDQTHVPMIFYVPGLPPRRVPDYVSTIDLGTTILKTLGLECPRQYVGVNLLPLMRGEATEVPPVFGEQTLREKEFPNVRPEDYPQPINKKYMIITQSGYKLIYNRNYYAFELFDLKSDPKEQRNLYDRMPDVASELRRRLGQFVDVVTVSRPPNADEAKYFFGDDEGDYE
jgi:arylsulfatase A-like enzyme